MNKIELQRCTSEHYIHMPLTLLWKLLGSVRAPVSLFTRYSFQSVYLFIMPIKIVFIYNHDNITKEIHWFNFVRLGNFSKKVFPYTVILANFAIWRFYVHASKNFTFSLRMYFWKLLLTITIAWWLCISYLLVLLAKSLVIPGEKKRITTGYCSDMQHEPWM